MYLWCNRISYCVSFRITHIVIFSRYRLYFKYQIANRNIGLSTFVLEAQDLPFFTCWSLFVVYLSSGLHWLAGLMVSIIITTSKKHPSETATGGVLQMKVFLAGHQACNCIEKRLQHRCFPVKFCKIFKTTYFTIHLRTTVLILLSFIRNWGATGTFLRYEFHICS